MDVICDGVNVFPYFILITLTHLILCYKNGCSFDLSLWGNRVFRTFLSIVIQRSVNLCQHLYWSSVFKLQCLGFVCFVVVFFLGGGGRSLLTSEVTSRQCLLVAVVICPMCCHTGMTCRKHRI